MSHAYVPRVNEGGNFCAHDPDSPQLSLAIPAAGNIPKIIQKAMDYLPDYFASPTKIPSLNIANGSSRQQRSERRESCIRILRALLKFCDVASLRVGIPTDSGFAGLTIPLLAKHAGLGVRRAERAVADLKAAGLLTVSPVAEKQPDGSYVGVAAVKAVSKHLWGLFGLLEALKRERDKAASRESKKDRKNTNITSRAVSRGALFLSGLRARLPSFGERQPADPELRRRLALREIELRQKYPDWPAADIQRKARQDVA
jgi:hypothetical protein